MNRKVIYSTIAIGLTGTVVLLIMKHSTLIIGWWLGVTIGLANFSTLLKSMERSKPEGGPKNLQALFFVRYLVLALAFFLVIRLGREQLGSSILGFLSLYIAFFVSYLMNLKKQKTN